MNLIRKIATLALAATPLVGCGEGGNPITDATEGACGPCGSVATGNFSVSGNAQLDGFFKAVGTLDDAVASIRGDFEANLRAIAAAWNVDVEGMAAGEMVAAIKSEVTAEIQANVQGSVQVAYEPPKCEANVDVAVQAQARCEAQADCEVEADPGEVSVACEGQCSGGCSGECSGELSCAVEAPSIECSGMCEGSCQLDAAAACEGTCRGECDGECSVRNAEGECAGSCDGMCTGTCEISGQAECSGTCTGTCIVDQGAAECTAEAECRGSCDAECSGSCTGSATPPSASAECEASADCQAQAEAQGSASLECSPPSLDLEFDFQAMGNAQAQAEAEAEFLAKLNVLKVRGIAIIQGAERLKLLIDGNAEAGIPSAVGLIEGQINGFVEGGVDGLAELDIPPGRIGCVIPAFQEAGQALADVAENTGSTISAQAEFVIFLTGGITSA